MGLIRRLGRKGYKALASKPVYHCRWPRAEFQLVCADALLVLGNWEQIGKIFTGLGIFPWLGVWLAVWICATAVLALWEWLRAALLSIKTVAGPVLTSRYARAVYASALGLTAFVTTVLLSQPAPGIVYKAF